MLAKGVLRRRAWLFGRRDRGKLLNLARATRNFLLKRETLTSMPVVVKIDISPLCNLHCTVCIHAAPNGDPVLEAQSFKPHHRMTLDQFRRIVDALAGKTAAVSLYYLGDPLLHPDLHDMCRIASEAGLQVHISTNFSFHLDDARIDRLVRSGLTHITVSLDGLSQENYQRTRVGGQIALVLENLERLCRARGEFGSGMPIIEVQYIKYQHNLGEIGRTRALCRRLGVDQFTTFWGALDNWAGRDPTQYRTRGPRERLPVPRCFWPHFSTVIKWNGDVIPCCTFRQGTQYVPGGDHRSLGNVFNSGLAEVWNSPAYQQVRRLVSDPSLAEGDESFQRSFCHACPVIFDTDYYKTTAWGEHSTFEEHYALDGRGRPVRRGERREQAPADTKVRPGG